LFVQEKGLTLYPKLNIFSLSPLSPLTMPTNMQTYIVKNKKYSPDEAEVTYDELVQFCIINGWDANLVEQDGKVLEADGDVVAVAA